MIVVRIVSGLGNQMFQYPFYLYMRKLYGDRTDVICDLYWFNYNDQDEHYLIEDIFPNLERPPYDVKKAGFSEVFKVTGIIPNFVKGRFSQAFDEFRRYPNRIIREFTQKKCLKYTYDENDDDFLEKVTHLDLKNDYYITGYFLDEKFYINVLDDVREAFTFKEITDDNNLSYVRQISETASVSVHVRRGDYLSDRFKDKFISLDMDFYKKAVDVVYEKLQSPTFFMFSDDTDYVREAFDWLDNKVIVTGNSGLESYRDMQLMSMCKANIIANSTFSQWGALLNQNKEYFVIYPAVYLYGKDCDVKTLKNWIRI